MPKPTGSDFSIRRNTADRLTEMELCRERPEPAGTGPYGSIHDRRRGGATGSARNRSLKSARLAGCRLPSRPVSRLWYIRPPEAPRSSAETPLAQNILRVEEKK